MANTDALSTTALSLQQLLRSAWNESPPSNAANQHGGSSEVSLVTLADLARPDPKPCISISIIHVSQSTATRSNSPWSGVDAPRSLTLDMHVLVAAWPKPNTTGYDIRLLDQMVFLGWAAKVIEKTPVLSAALLNDFTRVTGLTGTPFGRIRDANTKPVFETDESVTIAPSALIATEVSEIWRGAGITPQPSLAYVVRGIRIE